VFLEDRAPAQSPRHLTTLAFAPGEMGHRQLGAYIARSSDLSAIRTRFIPGQGYWLIDSSTSPVVEFSRWYFDGNVLRAGRAYFATDLRFRPSLPDPGFVKWGDRVLNAIRRSLLRSPSIASFMYASSAALEWIETSRATGSVGLRTPSGRGASARWRVQKPYVRYLIPRALLVRYRQVRRHQRPFCRSRAKFDTPMPTAAIVTPTPARTRFDSWGPGVYRFPRNGGYAARRYGPASLLRAIERRLPPTGARRH
jgi:hypothetical protein